MRLLIALAILLSQPPASIHCGRQYITINVQTLWGTVRHTYLVPGTRYDRCPPPSNG